MADSQLQILISAQDEASATIQKLLGELQRLNDVTGRGAGMQSLGSQLTSLGGAMTALTAPAIAMVGAVGLGVNQAIQFESAMANVSKVLGLNDIQTQEMGQSLLEMSRYLPVSAEGLAAIAEAGGSLGVPTADIQDFVELTAQMGVAFDMSADQAGDSIARLMNVMGEDLQGVSQLGDVINRLSDTSAATSADVVNALTRIGGVTRTFGLANEEAAALASAFISLGRPPEVAATAINSILPALQTATSGTEKFQEGLAAIGISASDMEQMVADDAMGAVTTFFDALGELDGTDRATAIRNMFGSGSDSALIASLAEDASGLASSLDVAREAMESAGNSMEAEFQNRASTTANQFQLLKNALSEVAINLGSAFLPAINSIVGAIVPLVQGFASFAAEHPRIVMIATAFAAVVAAIGPLLMLIGGLVSAVGTVVAAFGAGGVLAGLVPLFTGIGTAIAGAFGAIAAIGAGPILAVVAAIAAGAYLIIANWDTLKSWFSSFVSAIAPIFQQLGQNAMTTFSTIRSYIQGFIQGIQPALVPLGAMFQSLGTMITTSFQGFMIIGQFMLSILSQIGTFIMGWLVPSFQMWGQVMQVMLMPVMPIFQLLWFALQQVGAAFTAVTANATNFGMAVGMVFAAVISSIANVIAFVANLITAFASAASQIVSIITGLAGQMFSAGVNIIQSLISGIQSMMGAVTSAISGIASAIRGALPFSPPEYGPLSDIMSVGGNIVNSIIGGMNPAPVAAAMNRLLAPAGASMASPLNPASGGIGTPGQGGGMAPVTINVYAGAGADSNQIADTLEERLRTVLPRVQRGLDRDRRRVSYGNA